VSFFVDILLVTAVAAAPADTTFHTIPVCTVSSDAPAFIGKRVTLDGYINDLGSHGFVLAAKKGCRGRSLVKLSIDTVIDKPVWRRAFANSIGPKHAVLTGVVYWVRNRAGALVPALRIERVEQIAAHDADVRDF
jgi:hypothetical protein